MVRSETKASTHFPYPGSGSQKHPHGWLNPRTKPGFGGHDGCSTWVAGRHS